MKKYTAKIEQILISYIEIEASSEKEALEEFRRIDLKNDEDLADDYTNVEITSVEDIAASQCG